MENSAIRILLVDDDPILRDMHAIVFRDAGFQVETAENGQQACELLKTNDYELLIADIFMPDVTGIDIVVYCQQHHPALKTILLSGGGKELQAKHGANSINFNAKKIDVDLFLQKPFSTDEMLALVEKLFRH